jgi:hypothetical protein
MTIKKGSVYKSVPIGKIYSKPVITETDTEFEVNGFDHIQINCDVIVLDFLKETFLGVDNFWIKILYNGNKVGWLSLAQEELNYFKTLSLK